MKTKLLVTALVTAGLGLGMLSGCGGGGSSSSADAATAELDATTSNTLAVNAADALPGCSYQSDTDVSSSAASSAAFVMAMQQVNDLTDQLVLMKSANIRYDLAPEVIEGNCPTNPGSLTITGTHEDGVDDMSYVFDNYCLGDDVENLTMDGTADLKDVGTPSDDGPIPQYIELSTGSSGISAVETTADGGPYTHVVTITDGVFTNANGFDSATAEDQNGLSADLVSVVDGRSGETFTVTNADISAYGTDTTDVYTIKSITYTDPDTGSVTVSTTPIVVNADGVMTEGVITVSGANGTSMSMTLDPEVDNTFNVVFDGETVGVMNCADLASGELPL